MSHYITTVQLHKESMKFSSGHTTIFSATEREPLHGHSYRVALELTTEVHENGMVFDYRYYREKMHQLCRHLNRRFLMPQYSPYLTFSEDDEHYYFTFNHKKIPFLKEDVLILPVCNITVEELSRWFIEELIKDSAELTSHRIIKLLIKVFSEPGQGAHYEWHRP